MTELLIKICGVRHPAIASEAVLAGAHFIGIVFHPFSKRFVDLDTAKLIAAATKAQGALPVAVFVNHNAQSMLEICEATNINVIQLHGFTAKAQHYLLPKHYKRIFVQSLSSKGEVINDCPPYAFKYYDKKRDFLLLDNINAGSGQLINWQQLKNYPPEEESRWFLAGGLTATNVGMMINRLHPTGIDVSSGVENQLGEKDILLIQNFIKAANESEK